MERCIILNGDYTFLNTVNWKRAVCLNLKGKVEVLKFAKNSLKCAGGLIIKIPLVVKLIKVIRLIYRTKVPFSKKNIMIRDNFECAYCRSKNELTIDHIIPVSRGGKSTFENCITSCKDCNNKKGSRTPSEAKMYLSKKAYQPTISEFFRIKLYKLGLDKYLKEIGVY